jgi:hypothetical protein
MESSNSSSAQDTHSNLQVFCRIRPFIRYEFTKAEDREPQSAITQLNPTSFSLGNSTFNFTKVFPPDSTQVNVFDELKPSLKRLLVNPS